MRASRVRSLAKTVSWRVLATLTTIGLVYLFTREMAVSLGIGALEVVCKLVFYYLHERAWNRTSWGLLSGHEEEVGQEQRDTLVRQLWMKPGSRIGDSQLPSQD